MFGRMMRPKRTILALQKFVLKDLAFGCCVCLTVCPNDCLKFVRMATMIPTSLLLEVRRKGHGVVGFQQFSQSFRNRK
jgi:Na+-translocating ferredoxin:NAD+ oxidoreductase RNF subunit RnfB